MVVEHVRGAVVVVSLRTPWQRREQRIVPLRAEVAAEVPSLVVPHGVFWRLAARRALRSLIVPPKPEIADEITGAHSGCRLRVGLDGRARAADLGSGAGFEACVAAPAVASAFQHSFAPLRVRGLHSTRADALHVLLARQALPPQPGRRVPEKTCRPLPTSAHRRTSRPIDMQS
eukprot:1406893-Rhodomonas_salina.3